MEAFITYRRRLPFPDTLEGTPQDIALKPLGKFVDLIAGGQARQCVLRGNEATLHPDFEGILEILNKKSVVPLLETTGLVLDRCLERIREQQIPLVWRVYPKVLYPAAEWDEARSKIKTLIASRQVPVRLLWTTEVPCDPPGNFPSLIEETGVREVTFRVLKPRDLSAMRSYGAWLTSTALDLVSAGVRVGLDCGIPPCAFSDEAFGKLAKVGVSVGACHPRPGILPSMRVYHCHQMMDYPGGPVDMFRKSGQVLDYFYGRHNELQWDLRPFPECHDCVCLKSAVCAGPGLAAKAAALEERYVHLREVVSSEESLDALVEFGGIAYELTRFREAVEVLSEARRVDPGNAHVHLLLARALWESADYIASEEEFRKAARLVPQGKAVLMELVKRLEAKGNLFKSRRLLEEIKRMPDSEGAGRPD